MIYPFGDFKTLCFFYLTISCFGRVEREKSHRKIVRRNNYEQISKNRFQMPIDDSKTGPKTVMPYIFGVLVCLLCYCV